MSKLTIDQVIEMVEELKGQPSTQGSFVVHPQAFQRLWVSGTDPDQLETIPNDEGGQTVVFSGSEEFRREVKRWLEARGYLVKAVTPSQRDHRTPRQLSAACTTSDAILVKLTFGGSI